MHTKLYLATTANHKIRVNSTSSLLPLHQKWKEMGVTIRALAKRYNYHEDSLGRKIAKFKDLKAQIPKEKDFEKTKTNLEERIEVLEAKVEKIERVLREISHLPA